jgi:hypothetical protein
VFDFQDWRPDGGYVAYLDKSGGDEYTYDAWWATIDQAPLPPSPAGTTGR